MTNENMHVITLVQIASYTLVQQVCYMHATYSMHVIDCNVHVTTYVTFHVGYCLNSAGQSGFLRTDSVI